MMPILIVEELPLIEEGIRATLSTHLPDSEPVFFSAVENLPDEEKAYLIMVSLIQFTASEGVTRIASIKKRLPASTIIAYGVDAIPNIIRSFYNAGVSGYFSLDSSDLVACISVVSSGKTYFPSSLVNTFITHLQYRGRRGHSGLTIKQIEVARYLSRGHSNSAVAEKLGITPATVSATKRAVFKKLGIATISQLRETIRNL